MTKAKTPVRLALVGTSGLHPHVCDGLRAVERSHHRCLDQDIRSEFGDSLDLDSALKKDYPWDNRWDYLLGHLPTSRVIALEPHSAKADQVSTVIAKKQMAIGHLSPHMRPARKIERWIWVASGKNGFLVPQKEKLRLSRAGIQFVGNRVTAKAIS